MTKLSLYNRRFLFKNPFLFLGAVIIITINISVLLGAAFLNKSLVNSLENKNETEFYKYLIAMGILGLCAAIWYAIQEFTITYMSLRVVMHIRNEIANKLSDNVLQEFETKKPGTYLNWLMQDAQYIETAEVKPIFNIISSSLNLIISLALICYMRWEIGIVVFISIIILFAAITTTKKYIAIKKMKMSKKKEKFTNSIVQNLNSLETFYLNNKEEHIQKSLNLSSGKYYKKSLSFALTDTWITSLITIFLYFIKYSVLIFLGILLIKNPTIGIGIFLASSMLLTQSIDSVNFISVDYKSIKGNKGITEKILDKTSPVFNNDDYKDVAFDNMNINNLSFHYGDGKRILNNINLQFEKNKKYIITGKNGSGKSTLVKILMKQNELTDGEIIVNDLKNSHSIFLNNVAYASNKTTLFPGTLAENITFEKRIKNVELFQEINTNINLKFVSDKDLLKDVSEFNFSTGEMQRILLARSLYSKRKIIILDETLANIDKANRTKILNYLLSKNNITLLLVSHHLSKNEMDLFDEVIDLGLH